MRQGISHSFVADKEEDAVRQAMYFKLSNSEDAKDREEAKGMVTLSEAIDFYIQRKDKILSPSTIKSYRSIQKHRLQDVMNLPLSSDIDWQAVINNEAGEVKPKTVKNIWGMVSAVLRANKIAVEDIDLPPLVKSEHEFLQPEQIKAFVKAIEGHRFEMTYLLCLHGLRRSETCAVKKSNISDGYIHVRGAKVYDENGKIVERTQNKTYSSNRDVPIMIDRLEELVRQCTTEYLCPGNPTSTLHPLNTVCRQNGLPEVGLHGLRHSFASLCYHLGISELQCMKFGGWSDINVMRKIYTHLSESGEKSAELKLRSFFHTEK